MKHNTECVEVEHSQLGKKQKGFNEFFFTVLLSDSHTFFIAVTERSMNPGAEDRMKISSTLNITGKKRVINISRKDISKHRSNIGFSKLLMNVQALSI